MHGDAPDQPGATGLGYRMGNVTWVCLSMILLLVSLPAPARGQPEVEAATEIPVHPRVTTILQLPDDVVLARFTGQTSGMMRATKLRELLYIQPRAGLRAGTEVVLWVKTATLRRRFRLRVVAHARDARKDVLVLGPEAEPKPATSASAGALDPAPPEPGELVPTGEAPMVRPSRRTELSVHVVGSFGFTGLDIAGQQPFVARQPHAGLGARLVVTRTDARWALEANLTGDLPGGSMSFAADSGEGSPGIAMNGPWLRMETGIRGLLGGRKWNPSLYLGGGVQVHLRRTLSSLPQPALSETMPRGAVLVLGVGLQRRIRDLLLGVDFQIREGWPDGYHSAVMLWTVGSDLDPD